MSGRLSVCAVALAFALAACSPAQSRAPTEAERYLEDAAFRRRLLVATHLGRSQYVRTRLAYYASGDELDWERRESWNPRVRADGDIESRALDLTQPLSSLGREAFTRYPVQLVSFAGAPAAVSVDLDGGARSDALVCASCHAYEGVAGAANVDFDYGAALASSATDPVFVASRRSWGKGRVDVASPAGDEAVAIPDLRAVRYQTHLQYAGAVAQTSVAALALRIETLVITSHGGAIRPPRQVALGLALYLWSLAPPPHEPAGAGQALFAARCGACHRGDARAGGPVLVDAVATDPRAATSPYRGTGGYRVPTLVGVAARARLLHDGSVASLAALLDPTRTVGGHQFTMGLLPDEIATLLAYVQAL